MNSGPDFLNKRLLAARRPQIFEFSGFSGISEVFRGPGGSWRLQGRPAIHIPSQDIDFSSKNRFLKNRTFYNITFFDKNRPLAHKNQQNIEKTMKNMENQNKSGNSIIFFVEGRAA